MNSYPSHLNSTILKIVANQFKYVWSMRQLTGFSFNLCLLFFFWSTDRHNVQFSFVKT